MALKDDIPALIETHKNLSEHMAHNANLFDVFEGQLLPLLLQDLKKQLSENSFEQIKHRMSPINIMNKVVSKLSTIYSRPPIRTILGGKKKDQKSLGELMRVLEFDTCMQDANSFFNLFKATWVEPYNDGGVPRLRTIPSDRFFVWSNDKVDPTRPTHFVKIMGIDSKTNKVTYHAYTKDEFLIFDSDKVVDTAAMAELDNDGVNEYKALPGVYINRSKHSLIPKIDTDMLTMTKLIPILLSDANFALMYQSFAIIYGIDVDDENLKMAPNAFWRFKTSATATGDVKPEIGVLKPEVDTDKVLSFTLAQIALWLESKGIKPGAVGSLQVESAASGVAKIIDEADTTEDRKKQVATFAPKDAQLLELIVNNMIPVWNGEPEFKLEASFSGKDIRISSEFPEQKPILDEGAAADTEIKKLNSRLTTRKRAIKKLNPDMTEEEVEKLMAEIEAENPPVETDEEEGGGEDNPPPDGKPPKPKKKDDGKKPKA